MYHEYHLEYHLQIKIIATLLRVICTNHIHQLFNLFLIKFILKMENVLSKG